MQIIRPMLAQSAGKPFNRPNYIYEPKKDGVRCIAYLNDRTILQARSGKDITFKFPELAELHKQVKHPCILDGEICGTSFNAIQHRIHQQKPFAIRIAMGQYPCTFNGFDQLQLDDKTTEGVQLIDRKDLLVANFVESDVGLLLPWYEDYETAERIYRDTEGIMAKYKYSLYARDNRSAHWLKIKNFKEDKFVICGLTRGENDRASTFGALILGTYDDGKLTYVGNVGTGFTRELLASIMTITNAYRSECPFARVPDVDRPVLYWTDPQFWGSSLKCEVRYLELSPEGKLRFPSFRRMVK